MKTISRLFVIVLLIATVTVAVTPALAAAGATERTITITEQQANQSYWVTHPFSRAVSNVVVDFQPGKVVISKTVTLRNRPPVAVVTTYAPNINNGRLYWSVSSKTLNGDPISADVLAQINTSITTSWRNWVRGKLPASKVTAISITETEMTITLALNK